jgi:hypothetical protein
VRPKRKFRPAFHGKEFVVQCEIKARVEPRAI